MMRIAAMAGRELRSLLLAPGGWIIAALFALIMGFVFITRSFQQGSPASMHLVFDLGTYMLLFIAPAISMRAIAEERRTGTYEMLMTTPVSEAQIVAGKFIGLVAFLVLIMLPTLACVVALELHGEPDYGELLCGYAGLLLAGSAYLAGGILASVLTTHQAVAFLLALFFWLGVSLVCTQASRFVDPQWAPIIASIDPAARLNDFTIGLIDSANVAYFASITVVFLALAARIMEHRRWR